MALVTIDQRPLFDGGWVIRVRGSAKAEAYDLITAQWIAGTLEADIKAKEDGDRAVESLRGDNHDPSLSELLHRAFMLGRYGR